jgi:NADPH-dependent curcumin reductase CurA
MVGKELRMEGFLFGSYADEFPSILADLKKWVDEVRI